MSMTWRKRSLFGTFVRTTVKIPGLVAGVLFVAILVGCESPEQRVPAPRLDGTFSGTTSDGRAVTISLVQEENTVTGQGKVGDKVVGLSAITAPHGPLMIIAKDGTPIAGSISLSVSGKDVTLTGLDESITLNRGSTPLPVTPGAFAGRYATPGSDGLRLDLEQSGDLLAGTGFVEGKPVAVAGRITATNEARGSLLFSDGSRSGVRAVLSDDGKTLSVRGLGGTLEMRRQ